MPKSAETEGPLSRPGFAGSQWNSIFLLSGAGALVAALTVSIQPLLLDMVFGIAFEKEGAINADIQVVAEIASILGVGWFGLLSDRIGRLPVIKGGFLMICAGAIVSMISLQAGLTVGTGALALFYITRVLISGGADAVQLELSTLAGDVSDYHNRPRLLTSVIFMMVFGGTVLSAIIMQVAEHSGGILIIMALPLLIGAGGYILARRTLFDVAPKDESRENPLRQVWEFVSKDPRMQLAFVATFYTRADIVILSLFYSLWCISVSDIVGVTRAFATAHAAVLIGLLGAAVLASIPVWKIVIERHSRISAIGASLSLAGVGYLSLGLFANPFNWLVILPLILIGIGHAGCTVTLQVLTVDISPKPILGAVLGMAYLTGGAGIIMLTQSGGYYFDAVGPRAPFMLMGTAKLLVTLYAGWLLVNGIDETSDHQMKSSRKIDWKPLVFLTAALPFVWLVGRSMIGGYLVGGSLTETPVGFINRYLGDWAFTFLIISLAMRPIQEISGIKILARYRRMIGLYAFFYAVLHVIAFISLEWAFNIDDMIADVYKRPFIIFGLLSFMLMVPLAVTSTNAQIKRIGGKRWKQLHKSVYIINFMIAMHFIFAANHENGEPYIYAIAVLILLGYRAVQSNQWPNQWPLIGKLGTALTIGRVGWRSRKCTLCSTALGRLSPTKLCAGQLDCWRATKSQSEG
ncbi:Magnetosome protein MamZ [Azospirillaceae bacterium]|nr:magnetosome protein MamZ [uncultured bacterium]